MGIRKVLASVDHHVMNLVPASTTPKAASGRAAVRAGATAADIPLVMFGQWAKLHDSHGLPSFRFPLVESPDIGHRVILHRVNG